MICLMGSGAVDEIAVMLLLELVVHVLDSHIQCGSRLGLFDDVDLVSDQSVVGVYWDLEIHS